MPLQFPVALLGIRIVSISHQAQSLGSPQHGSKGGLTVLDNRGIRWTTSVFRILRILRYHSHLGTV